MLVSICIMATVCLVLAIIYLIKSRKPDAIISWQNKWTDMNNVTLLEKDRITNSKIGPVADHYERWNCTSFVIWIFRGKSKLYIYTKNSLLMINLHIKQANKDVGPCTAKFVLLLIKINDVWNCTIFVIWVFRERTKLCIYNKHSLLINNLHEQQAYTFVQFSKLAKNCHFFTHIIVNISNPHLSIQKVLIYKEFLTSVYKNWIGDWGQDEVERC